MRRCYHDCNAWWMAFHGIFLTKKIYIYSWLYQCLQIYIVIIAGFTNVYICLPPAIHKIPRMSEKWDGWVAIIWAPARSPSDCLVPSFWTGARWRAPSQWNGPTWGPWGPVTDVIEKKPWAQGQLAGKLYDNYDNYMIIMILWTLHLEDSCEFSLQSSLGWCFQPWHAW